MTQVPNAEFESGADQNEGRSRVIDFDVRVAGRGGSYVVTARSVVGELRAPLGPIDRELVAARLERIRQIGSFRGRGGPTGTDAARDLGIGLFACLFRESVLSGWGSVSKIAADSREYVRLRLSFEAPELAALPWEFLFDPERGEFIGAGTGSVLRRIDTPRPSEPLAVTGPLRILGLIPAPSDTAAIDVQSERKRVEDGLGRLVSAGQVELTWLADASRGGFLQTLGSAPWHALIYIGGGAHDPSTADGWLVFADPTGRGDVMSARELSSILRETSPIRLVALLAAGSAPEGETDLTSTATALVIEGLEATVATRFAMSDQATIAFLGTFFDAVSIGLPVDEAVDGARSAIRSSDPDSIEWAVPVLTTSVDGGLFSWVDRDASSNAAPQSPDVAQVAKQAPVDEVQQPAAGQSPPEEAPTTDRRRSPYSSDQVPLDGAITDHLQMEREVEALAWVAADRDNPPPLAIGLFGAWGTGKSTFMQLMRERVKQISKDARTARNAAQPEDHPACEHIRQITFNAWHYADANLWASLVTYIFEVLAKPADIPAADAEYLNLLDKLATTQSLREAAEDRKRLATQVRERRTDELDGVRQDRQATARGLETADLDPTLIVRDIDLRVRSQKVAAEVDPRPSSTSVVVAATDWLSTVLADPELVRRAVEAVPDDATSTQLLAILERDDVQEELKKAATDPQAREALVKKLAEATLTTGNDGITALGALLKRSYGDALALREVHKDLTTIGGKLAYLLRYIRQSITANRVAAAVFIVGVGLIVSGVLSFAVLNAAALVSVLAAVSGVVASVLGYAPIIREPVRRLRKAVEFAVDAVQARAKRQIDLFTTQEQALQQDIEQAIRDEHEAERELDDIRQGRRLYRYIEERAQATDYKPYLGVIAQVRKDFTRLEELMAEGTRARELDFRARRKAALAGLKPPRPVEAEPLPAIDRVILYIDDLDRCPVDRVVQVLEAVHLLLALKLFIVVVGVDPRWLMRSLRNHYAAQLTPGGATVSSWEGQRSYWESTPENYLEKIFQVPFSLRPMTPTGYETLMTDLLGSSVETPKPTTGAAEDRGANAAPGSAASTGSQSSPTAGASVATTLAPDRNADVGPPDDNAGGVVIGDVLTTPLPNAAPDDTITQPNTVTPPADQITAGSVTAPPPR